MAPDAPDEIDADELAQQLAASTAPILLDVREFDECASGILPSALQIPRGSLSAELVKLPRQMARTIVVYCASGVRSADVARELGTLGFTSVRSLRGGIMEWRRRGHACVTPSDRAPHSLLSDEQLERYARHLRLAEVGAAGQRRLLDARVLCIGAGGLGSPASLYLAAAGIGTLGIVDDDHVDLSNLQRQILHTTARVGTSKTASASIALNALNSATRVIQHETRLAAHNALEILRGYDIVVDGSDNLATRYLVNDAALRLGKPVVYGAVQQFEGQVSLFAGAPCYRCLFPEPPPAGAAPSCQEVGVLGVLPGIIGVLQATEAIKWLLGIGESLLGRLLVYDALSCRFTELRLDGAANCAACAPGVDRSQIELIDGAAGCARIG